MGPVGAVRVGRIDGAFVTNPTTSQLAESDLDLVVAGTREAVMMVEAGANIVPESVMADAIAYGHAEAQKSIDLQEKLVEAVGKPKRQPFIGPKADSVAKIGARLAGGDTEFVVLDLETTSMKPDAGAIVDVAALRVRDGQVVDRFESLVNPGRSIIGHQIHGISDADVSGAPAVGDVIGEAGRVHRPGAGRRPQRGVRPAVHHAQPPRRVVVGADRGVRHARARVPALSGCRQLQARRPRALRLRP